MPVLTPAQWADAAERGERRLELRELRPHREGGAREHRLEDFVELVVQLAPLRAQVDERNVGHTPSFVCDVALSGVRSWPLPRQ